ncbi:MAG: hypothetical protein JXB04_04840, partial [Kiritimatiellae bacterium]|nr:hypothetical protein [Kiritimatiellia bacterium]
RIAQITLAGDAKRSFTLDSMLAVGAPVSKPAVRSPSPIREIGVIRGSPFFSSRTRRLDFQSLEK